MLVCCGLKQFRYFFKFLEMAYSLESSSMFFVAAFQLLKLRLRYKCAYPHKLIKFSLIAALKELLSAYVLAGDGTGVATSGIGQRKINRQDKLTKLRTVALPESEGETSNNVFKHRNS